MTIQKIAFLGTGIMGLGMAANLLKAGFPVTVWNRTAAKAQPLIEAGATPAATPAEAVTGADIIFSIVGDDDSSRRVWLGGEGVLAGSPQPGAICIECTTISLGWAHELAAQLAEAGLRFIDCPVTGGSGGAENGTLTLLVGADEAVLNEARPALEAISSKTIVFGPPGAGTGYKLLYNLMGATQMVSLAEALLTAEKLGLNMQSVIEGINQRLHGQSRRTGLYRAHGQPRPRYREFLSLLDAQRCRLRHAASRRSRASYPAVRHNSADIPTGRQSWSGR